MGAVFATYDTARKQAITEGTLESFRPPLFLTYMVVEEDVYVSAKELPRVLDGMGLVLLSTSKGVLNNYNHCDYGYLQTLAASL